MKISIIGGGGLVGSNAAFAFQMAGVGSELVLVDANTQMAAGQALDLLHGASYTSPQRIVSGGYDLVEGSEFVVITAGLRRKPDESRLDLINRNVQLFQGILEELRKVALPKNCTILVVTNPVDILTHLAVQKLGLDVDKWKSDYNSEAVNSAFFTRRDQAASDQVNQTPTFIITGPKGTKTLVGAVNPSEFDDAIAEVQ